MVDLLKTTLRGMISLVLSITIIGLCIWFGELYPEITTIVLSVVVFIVLSFLVGVVLE